MSSRPVAIVALLISLGTRVIGAQAPLREGFETIGEALTATAAGGDIEFGWRMFTIYTLDDACRTAFAERTARLRTDAMPITARIGQPFLPAHLKISALDRTGRVLPRVPITVEVNAPLRFFDSHLPDAPDGPPVQLGIGPLVPRRPGMATLRARTICPDTSSDVLVEFRSMR